MLCPPAPAGRRSGGSITKSTNSSHLLFFIPVQRAAHVHGMRPCRTCQADSAWSPGKQTRGPGRSLLSCCPVQRRHTSLNIYLPFLEAIYRALSCDAGSRSKEAAVAAPDPPKPSAEAQKGTNSKSYIQSSKGLSPFLYQRCLVTFFRGREFSCSKN